MERLAIVVALQDNRDLCCCQTLTTTLHEMTNTIATSGVHIISNAAGI